MTYEQIEKEFDDCEHLETGMCDMNVAKSFLKQSFIKYLKDEVERLEKMKHNIGYKVFSDQIKDEDAWIYAEIYSDQITHITNQIRELEK